MREISIPRIWLCLGFFTFFLLTTLSCERKVIHKETVLRRGVLYQTGEHGPFSGIVVGKGREGYRRKVCTFEKTYEDGLLHGVTCYWYQNGKMESKENYVKGRLHGIVTRYYPSGKPKERLHFENGMRGGGRGEMFWDQKGRKTKR